MREYFVAERLCTALDKDTCNAEAFLREVPVNHEILDFAVQRLRKFGPAGVEATLLALIQSAVKPPPEGVGGRALTLYYRWRDCLPRDFDWRRKNFDGVDLEGADLSGLDFSGSSLRHAILANVNLEDSDFRDCDLTGVRIEETKPVAALAADPSGERIVAAYSDGAVRSWQIRSVPRPASTLVGKWPAGVGGTMGIHESGLVWLHANDEWWLLSGQNSGLWNPITRFRVADGVIGIRPRANLVAVTHIGSNRSAPMASLVELDRDRTVTTATPGATRSCLPLGGEGFVWSDATVGFRVQSISSSGTKCAAVLRCPRPSSLDVRTGSNGMHIVAGGTEAGAVHVWKLEMRDGVIESQEIFARSIHEGTVTGVTLLDDAHVASGGSDCVVAVTGWAEDGTTDIEHRLQLRLRCRRMKIDGLKGETERLVLRKLIENAETAT